MNLHDNAKASLKEFEKTRNVKSLKEAWQSVFAVHWEGERKSQGFPYVDLLQYAAKITAHPDGPDAPETAAARSKREAECLPLLREKKRELDRAARLRRLPDPVTGDGWNRKPEPRQWLLQDWLPAGELALLTGRGAAGKSLLVLQLAAALACTREALPEGGWIPGGAPTDPDSTDCPALSPDPCSVVIANWEDGANEALWRRVRMAHRDACPWVGDPSISERLHFLPMRGAGPVWAPVESGGGARHMANMGALTEAGEALRLFCEDRGARLLVVDPASLAFSVEENSRPLVSLALESWAAWASASGCAVLLTAHPAKAKEGEGAVYSGSTAWRGLVRSLWTLQPERKKNPNTGNDQPKTIPTGRTIWRREKANYSRPDDEDGGLRLTPADGFRAWTLRNPKRQDARTNGAENPYA